MKLEQIYTGCIAHAAYYLESEGEAAVFDPLRDVEPYLRRVEKDQTKLKYVFETHFHADFVSGHLDLAKKSGATIVYGPTAKPQFEALVAFDGQDFWVGKIRVQAIHTPGHTMESTCYLIYDEAGKMHGLISGDTLFINDVGRPDLAQHVISELTPQLLASHLYDSLRNKIMVLPDELIVYPNHGAGSACGKNMSKETTDTLGHQKEVNYALRADMTREEFIAELLEGQTTPPGYFPKNVLMNIQGYESLDTIRERALVGLTPEQFQQKTREEEALILDVRDAETFAAGFVPGSINIGLDGQFAPWVGALISDLKQPILLITPDGREEETVERLTRVGYDFAIGYLRGGLDAWKAAGFEVDSIQRLDASELESLYTQEPFILDVRNAAEYKNGHLVAAQHAPLDYLNDYLQMIPKDREVNLHCAGGYRSMIAASILRSRGWNLLRDVRGGYAAIRETGLPVEGVVCSKTAELG